MKKTLVLVLALALVLVAFAGCNSNDSEKIGATIYRFDDNFMSYVRQNMTKIAEDMGVELDIQDSQNDQAKQGEQVDLFLSQGVSSLAINLVDPQAASTIIDLAKAEDVPVVFYNKEPSAEDMQSYDKCWYVGTTSSESGVIQGEMMADAWKAHPEWDTNGDGVMQYVMLKGEPGHPDAEARTTYSIQAVVDAGIEVEELEIDTAMWDTTQAYDKMSAWYSSHGDGIEFVVCNNDGMAIGVVNYLVSEGYFEGDKFMPVVGVDAIPEALDLIEQGKLVGTVLNDALNQARATVELAANAAKGLEDPTEGTDWTLGDDKAVRVAYVGILLDNIDVAKECYGITDSAVKEEEPEEVEMGKVGATIYRFDDNFMSYVRQNMTTIAEDMGLELDIQDSQNDQAKQGEQVDLFLSQGVSSLAINLVDPQAASTIIDLAKAEDVPVVFYNKEPSAADMESYDKCWYVGTTSSESGVIQGEMIAEAWLAHPEWDTNGDGVMQYVMLKGEPGHPDAEARTTYSIEAVRAAGIEVEELEIDTAMWDTTQAYDKMSAWYSSHGEGIEFVVCNNDGMAIGVINYLVSEGYFEGDKFMPVVGVDAIPEALDLIEQGKLVGTVLNDALNQARATVELAANAAKGMEDPTEGTDWTLDDGKAVRVAYVGILLDNIDIAKECYGID